MPFHYRAAEAGGFEPPRQLRSIVFKTISVVQNSDCASMFIQLLRRGTGIRTQVSLLKRQLPLDR
jgi:hypothetical protein